MHPCEPVQQVRPLLIAVEGIDGSGKTSAARAAAALLADFGVEFVSRRTIASSSPFVRRIMGLLSDILWNSGDSRELPAEFWISAQAAWFSALSEHGVRPKLDLGRTVLVDGWVYKFFARLELQGHDFARLARAFAGALRPDQVILLDVDVGTVIARGRQMRPTELGLHAGLDPCRETSFAAYQAKVLRNLQRYGSAFDWATLEVGAAEAEADTGARLAREVQSIMRRPAIGEPTSMADP
jgi:thymidylate kinase